MRVKKMKLSGPLDRVVAFLNFNFESPKSAATLKSARLNFYELRSPKWKVTGKRLQNEIRSDLIPLLTGESTDEFVEREERSKLRQQWQGKRWRDNKRKNLMLGLMSAEPRLNHGSAFYLSRLLEKVSRLDLKFRWHAESGKHEETVSEPDLTKPLSKESGFPRSITDTERKRPNPAFRLLGAERRIVVLRGEKFIVCRDFSYANSFRELFYGIIAESLENGTFAKLRMCLRCRTVFVAADLKRKFCRDRCKDEFHNTRRLADGYFRNNREKRKNGERAKARRLQALTR
jgi:hypothetical protein